MSTKSSTGKLTKQLYSLIPLLFLSLITTGCGSIVTKKAPPFSHIHIGHALTGWAPTPSKKGLISTAEQEAGIALSNAVQASKSATLQEKKKYISNALHAVDPKVQASGPGLGYGLTRALTESIAHLQYAADSDDASANIKRSVPTITSKAQNLARLSNQLKVYGGAAKSATSISEINALGNEFLSTIKQINTGAYNIKTFRSDIQAMASREKPAYTTVDSYYLFNLIRLPSGKWAFRSSKDTSGNDSGTY